MPAIAPGLISWCEGVEGDCDEADGEVAMVGEILVEEVASHVEEISSEELVSEELVDKLESPVEEVSPEDVEAAVEAVAVISLASLRSRMEVGNASQDHDDQVLVPPPVGIRR